MNLLSMTPKELLQLDAAIKAELRNRGFLRTNNAPLGDYAVYLACKFFSWDIAPNSEKSFDATDKTGIRYQIKARRIVNGTAGEPQLSELRGLDGDPFDYLIGKRSTLPPFELSRYKP